MPRRTQTLSDEAIDTLSGLADEALDDAIKEGDKNSVRKFVHAKDELESLTNGNAVKVGEKKERQTRGKGRKRGLPNTEEENAADT